MSVCVQTESEQGYEDPFPLLTHLNTIQSQADTSTVSPPTTKTSYTGHSLPHIYPQFSQDVDNCHYKISMDNMVSWLEVRALILIGFTFGFYSTHCTTPLPKGFLSMFNQV